MQTSTWIIHYRLYLLLLLLRDQNDKGLIFFARSLEAYERDNFKSPVPTEPRRYANLSTCLITGHFSTCVSFAFENSRHLQIFPHIGSSTRNYLWRSVPFVISRVMSNIAPSRSDIAVQRLLKPPHKFRILLCKYKGALLNCWLGN